MLLSKIFTKLENKINFTSDEGTNKLIELGLVFPQGGGVFSFSHLGFMLLKNIEKIISDEFAKINCFEIQLPTLQREEIWSQTNSNYGEETFRTNEYILAPTAEIYATEYVKNFLSTYKQLPIKFFQSNLKFRNELRPRFGLIRCREFLMNDAYTFASNEKEAEMIYTEIYNVYKNIFQKLNLDFYCVQSDAGVIGGKITHEFLCEAPGECDFYYENNQINPQINNYKDFENIKTSFNPIYINKSSSIEIAHIYLIGDIYSKALNLTYKNKEGDKTYPLLASYGIGVSRLLPLLINKSILPKSILPFQIYLINKDNSLDLYNKLKQNYSVCLDDRENLKEKFIFGEKLGIHIIIYEINNNYEINDRYNNKQYKLNNYDELTNLLKKII